jgi:hypothetical protein
VTDHRWLLLGHQLPTRASNARVKIWRRLQQIGAVPARNSVYVLPNTEQCREDFEWVRSEIVALGGEATVFAADAISDEGTEDIVAAFRRAREEEYKSLKTDADRLSLAGSTTKGAAAAAREQRPGRALRALRDRFAAIERIDFFEVPAKAEAAASLAALERRASGKPRASAATPSTLHPTSFRRRRWVTRRRPGVDRMASAWLIRHGIDSEATFAFVDRPDKTDIPFDMYTGEFSHQGNSCTFEVLADRFGLRSPAVTRIGHIVHDLDMKETKFDPPEAAAVGRMVEGLRVIHADDATLLEQGIVMFDALARSFESESGPISASQAARRTKPKVKRRRQGEP